MLTVQHSLLVASLLLELGQDLLSCRSGSCSTADLFIHHLYCVLCLRKLLLSPKEVHTHVLPFLLYGLRN